MGGRSVGLHEARGGGAGRAIRARRVAVIALLVTGCAASTPSVTPDGSVSEQQSVSPEQSVSPSQPVDRGASELLVRMLGDITVGTHPDMSDGSGLIPGQLLAGDLVWIADRAQVRDETWYLVVSNHVVGEFGMLFGWLPELVDGARTTEPAALDCPGQPVTVPAAAALGIFGGLACFGDDAIELVGYSPIGCGAGSSPRTGTPEWLNGTWTAVSIGDAKPEPPDFTVGASITASAAPTGAVDGVCGAPGWYRWLGHHDDPAAATCRTETSDGARIIRTDPRLSQLLCRASLVLTDQAPIAGPP